MYIKTKADIGDTTYFLTNNRVITAVIKDIAIEVTEQTTEFGTMPNLTVYYNTNTSNKIHETNIFLTKQELLDSL